ncbi:unnamed protein product [Closterium sp. NIES-65]|nr:unnamed protein product [Closterium sp. NIES-65]
MIFSRAKTRKRTPCIGFAPSAMARMTAVAMLLSGLLVALLLSTAIAAISTTPLAEDTWCASIVQGSSVFVLYSAITTLVALLWWMGVTHTRYRAWVHQQGLAAGLMKLKSASKCLEPCGIFSLLHSPMRHASFRMQRVGEAVGTIMASMVGTRELGEEMEMRMRALGLQLEETRREFAATNGGLEEAEKRRAVEMREIRGQVEERERELFEVKGELAAMKGELAEYKSNVQLRISQSEGHTKPAWARVRYHNRLI